MTTSILPARSYSVIFFQSPEPKALWKKPEDHRRDFRLEHIANGYPRWRIWRVDQFENMFRHQVRFGRGSHVVIDRFPCFFQTPLVARLRLRAFVYRVVERGADVTGLKINNAHARIRQFQL